MRKLKGQFLQLFGGISGAKYTILQTIQLGIGAGIAHRIGDDLYAEDLSGILGQVQADAANSTVRLAIVAG